MSDTALGRFWKLAGELKAVYARFEINQFIPYC
jgi:hypothetical protein